MVAGGIVRWYCESGACSVVRCGVVRCGMVRNVDLGCDVMRLRVGGVVCVVWCVLV